MWASYLFAVQVSEPSLSLVVCLIECITGLPRDLIALPSSDRVLDRANLTEDQLAWIADYKRVLTL